MKLQFRRTTVIIDGSYDEYDGVTLGFNHFENFDRDNDSNDIRHKIGDVRPFISFIKKILQ